MISNLSTSVKLNKSKQSQTNSAVVEYSTPEEAEKAASTALTASGTPIEAELVSFTPRDKGDKSKNLAYKSKVYIGNLSEDFTEDLLKSSLPEDILPKVTFLSKPKGQKKYAFLEFTTETDRNVALGALEKIKQGGAFGDDAIVSPAYPYTQKPRSNRRNKPKTEKDVPEAK